MNQASNEINLLKDEELTPKIKSLFQEERKLTQNILEHIAEVDKRKLYLKMAHSSLFDYLTKEIGYSAGAAHRRIDASRLLQQIPDVSKKIENGSLCLTQISKAQKVFREFKKANNKPVHVEIKKEVIKKLENKNTTQTDLILAQEFNLEIKTETKQIQRDESVRVELTFSKTEMALIKQAQRLLSHKTGGNLKDTLVALAEKLVKQKTAIKALPTIMHKPTSTVEVKIPKTITPKLRNEILTRDQTCQYKDHKTGKICESQYFLEVDHIQPKFANGTNHSHNLRILCKNHNIFRYEMDK